MRVAITAAGRELLRFFRRRESFWLLAGIGAVCSVPFALQAAAFGPWADISRLGFESSIVGVPEIVHNYVARAEFLALAVLAYSLAGRALAEEIEGGSWALLRLAPVSIDSILLGKALGIAVVLAAVHGWATSLLLLQTPFLRRSHLEVWTEIIGALLVALAVIPEGFAHSALGPTARGGPLLFRSVTVLRAVVLVTIVRFTFATRQDLMSLEGRPPGGGDAGAPMRALYAVLSAPARGPGPQQTAAELLLPWAFALAWLGVSGLVLWRLVVRRWRS